MVFQMPPDGLGRIQFRPIAGQKFQDDASPLSRHKVPDHAAAVLPQSIPDNQQPAGDVPQQVFQKFDDLRAADRSRKQAEVEVPIRDAGRSRKRRPVNNGIAAPASVPAAPTAVSDAVARSVPFHRQRRLCAFVFGRFFTWGQRTCFQRRIAFSFRSKARPTGRWHLHPSSRRMRQTWTFLYRTPHSRLIRSATRQLWKKSCLPSRSAV